MYAVVADTSPLNYLVLIGHVDVLPSLYGRVMIPAEVRTELLHPYTPPLVKSWIGNPPAWMTVANLAPTKLEFHQNAGAGERGAITLALEVGLQLILVDDGLALSEARRFGLKGIGTLGILRQAHQQGLLDLRTALDRLQKTSFRSTPKLVAEVLREI